MRKYLKNKDFIPEKFYNKKESSKNKKEKEILLLLLIINLILIPITTKSIRGIKETPIVNNDDIYNNKLNKINTNDINVWIESIIKDDIEEVYITNNNGEVIVNNLEKIDELSSNNFIKINEVNLNSNGKYNLGVSLDE